MEIQITFPGDQRVDASFGGFRVATDQPRGAGGDGAAPAPFQYFLASLATCAGFFVMAFLDRRGIPRDAVSMTLRADWDAAQHRVPRVVIEIGVSPSFPERYRRALGAVVDQCTVKQHLERPPAFETRVRPLVAV